MPRTPAAVLHAMRELGALGADVSLTRRMRENAVEIYNALSRLVAEWDDETLGNSPACPDCRMPVPRPPDGRLCAYHEAVRVVERVRGTRP